MPATTVFADFERDFADFESMTQMDRFPVSSKMGCCFCPTMFVILNIIQGYGYAPDCL